ncbi:hypothetical protein HPB47_026243 [Ixodes persulcatus]|uniref:Uncharacterized protein n=1 Tax=Ixodes persulcatus TaxID=34615 RepID=A0AC60PZ83_IXOPE|nr:hypothetical protein HPB47_026243 [Ixodes persulcatus]
MKKSVSSLSERLGCSLCPAYLQCRHTSFDEAESSQPIKSITTAEPGPDTPTLPESATEKSPKSASLVNHTVEPEITDQKNQNAYVLPTATSCKYKASSRKRVSASEPFTVNKGAEGEVEEEGVPGGKTMPAPTKTALLLSIAGDDALEVYNNFAFSADEDWQDYATIVGKFDGYFAAQLNELACYLGKLPILGQLHLPATFGDRTVPATLVVVNCNGPSLCGRDLIQQFALLPPTVLAVVEETPAGYRSGVLDKFSELFQPGLGLAGLASSSKETRCGYATSVKGSGGVRVSSKARRALAWPRWKLQRAQLNATSTKYVAGRLGLRSWKNQQGSFRSLKTRPLRNQSSRARRDSAQGGQVTALPLHHRPCPPNLQKLRRSCGGPPESGSRCKDYNFKEREK